MKISEIKGEQAITVLAEIIDPITTILADTEVQAAKKDRVKAIQIALRKYPKEIIHCLALIEGEDPATYQPSLMSIPKKLVEITEDEDVKSLFISAVATADKEHSGDVQEDTQDKA